MSRSSLWVMNDKFEGFEAEEFSNSWLFSPVIWDILFEKYTPENMFGPYGRVGYISSVSSNSTVHTKLNDKINNCKSTADRVCWEMSNQQIFFTANKKIIVDSILQFLKDNMKYDDGVLTKEHIIERFEEISKEILALDENEHPYFILKNTSCDDNVAYWFRGKNEEDGEYQDINLSEQEESVAEFVVFSDDKISKFVTNLDFFSELSI